MPVEVADVHEVLDLLAGAGVTAILCGGWGVDALVGEQTRPHGDIDLWVSVEDDGPLRAALARAGFTQLRVDSPSSYVLADQLDRQIDVHLVRFKDDGSAVYDVAGGDPYMLPPEVFTVGTIGGREVRCVNADQQMMDHAGGYVPGATDFADMRLLHERLGTPYLPPFGE
jgi:lincosamide nucleotidyltransferase A/C/D/E